MQIYMSKINRILLGIWGFVYIIALIIIHMTYRYPLYWAEESTVIIVGSLIYIMLGVVLYCLYWLVNRKTTMLPLSGVSVKNLTIIVACASALKAFICICIYKSDDYIFMLDYQHGHPLMNTMGWMMISVFFFTLYKNMR